MRTEEFGVDTPHDDLDPLTREVVLAAVKAITYEMEGIVGRAAMSDGFRDKKDYFIGLFSTTGAMFHALTAYSGSGMVRPVLRHYPPAEMREGDLFFFNDPYSTDGAVQHLPDSVVSAPIVHDSEVIGMVAAFGHVEDVGGLGGRSSSHLVKDTWHEGVAYPPMQVGRDWRFDDWFIRLLERNTRTPAIVSGDLAALMSACRLGAKRLSELCAHHGRDAVGGALAWSIEETARRAREVLADRLEPGVYATEQSVAIVHMDEPRTVRLELTYRGGELAVDLSRTDDEVPVPMNYTCSHDGLSLLLALQMLVFDPDLTMNEGLLSLIDRVHLRPGSLVSPRYPAPIQNRSQVKSAVSNCLGSALALATHGRMTAPQPSYVIAEFRFGTEKFTETLGVGLGARPFGDGPDVVYAPAQRNYPVESVEAKHPLEVLAYQIVQDSGGAGEFRGGCGVRRRIKVNVDGTVSPLMSNTTTGSAGTHGGAPGAVGTVTVVRRDGTTEQFPGVATGIPLQAGDVVELTTPGGGGWGRPYDRPAEKVRRDVITGFVSAEAAEKEYGVVLTPELTVDGEATARLRREGQ